MRPRVLLVDDSPTVRNILKVYLMNLQVDFTEAEDGERALQVMRLVPVDLVIADINMPKRDGISFCKEVRQSALSALRSVPVILLTGDKTELLRTRGVEAGCNAFILKPVSGTELQETVQRLLAARAAEGRTPPPGGASTSRPAA